MFKTILATAAAALIAATLAAPAHADGTWYGKWPNGISLNGWQLQGVEMNGTLLNGRFMNGRFPNGRKKNGPAAAASSFALEGIELPASVR